MGPDVVARLETGLVVVHARLVRASRAALRRHQHDGYLDAARVVVRGVQAVLDHPVIRALATGPTLTPSRVPPRSKYGLLQLILSSCGVSVAAVFSPPLVVSSRWGFSEHRLEPIGDRVEVGLEKIGVHVERHRRRRVPEHPLHTSG